MTGFAKGMIITGIVLVILLVAGVAAGVYWISQQSGPLLARGKEAMEEGRRFGASTDNHCCVAATLASYKKEPGFTKAITSQLFLSGCLPTSRATTGFCADVPGPTEITNTVKWQLDQCSRAGLTGDSYCGQLFGPVQKFCELQRQGSK